MGRLSKKIQHNMLETSPEFVLDSIFNYLKIKGNEEEEQKIYNKLHLSSMTRRVITGRTADNISPAELKKIRIELAAELGNSFKALKTGFADKIAKLKLASEKATKQSKKDNEKGMKNLRAYHDGKIHELLPLNFRKSYTSLRFENIRWFIDINLNKENTFNDTPFRYIFNKLNIKIHKPGNSEVELFQEDSYNNANEINHLFFDYTKSGISISGEELLWFITVMGYIYGANSTFLLGIDTNPVLFEGVAGLSFRSEHTRMKLIKLVLDGTITDSEDIEKIKILLLRPLKTDLLTEICDKYQFKVESLVGKYQPLRDGEEALTSLQFREKIKETFPDDKIFKINPWNTL